MQLIISCVRKVLGFQNFHNLAHRLVKVMFSNFSRESIEVFLVLIIILV